MYLAAFTGNIVYYPVIFLSILSVVDVLLFLMFLQRNQVCIVHSLDRFSCGLGRPKSARNRILGLLGDKVGGSLPPILMVPASGLVQWIQLETQINLAEADLGGLVANL